MFSSILHSAVLTVVLGNEGKYWVLTTAVGTVQRDRESETGTAVAH